MHVTNQEQAKNKQDGVKIVEKEEELMESALAFAVTAKSDDQESSSSSSHAHRGNNLGSRVLSFFKNKSPQTPPQIEQQTNQTKKKVDVQLPKFVGQVSVIKKANKHQ